MAARKGPVQLKINFSEELREKLIAAGDQARRSMTAEIVHRLEQSFEAQEVKPRFDFTRTVRDLISWLYQTIKYQAGEYADDEDVEELNYFMIDLIYELASTIERGTKEEKDQFYAGKKLAAEAEELVKVWRQVRNEDDPEVDEEERPPLGLRLRRVMQGRKMSLAEKRALRKK
jgi:hypothetical protein